MADVIPKSLFESINFETMYANAVTSATLKGAFCPVIMPNDKAALQCLLKTCNARLPVPRLIYIRDTLTLDRFWVSKPLAEELAGERSCTVSSLLVTFAFGADNSLIGPDWN
jgi:hypothetical protein